MKIYRIKFRMPVFALGCLLLGNVAFAEETPGSTLESVLDYARDHNPEFAAARQTAEAAHARLGASDALSDPVLRTELMDVTHQGTNRYLLMQSIPWFGKRGLQHESAEARLHGAEGAAALSWTDLSAGIKTAYARYHYFSESRQLTREMLDWFRNLEQIAQTRYADGLETQQAVISSQVEQSVLQTGLIDQENALEQQRFRLNALLSRPALAALDVPRQARDLPAATSLDVEALSQKLLAHNPELRVADAQRQFAEKGRDLAYLDRYPDLTLGVAPNQTGNTVQRWDLMLEFKIPLQQYARRSREREAEAELAASSSRTQALGDQLRAKLAQEVYALTAAQKTENLLVSQLLPQSRMNWSSALAAYETAQSGFAALVEAQRQMLRIRQKILSARLEGQIRLAEIERLLGEDL
jgi:outer membrane protein TolC